MRTLLLLSLMTTPLVACHPETVIDAPLGDMEPAPGYEFKYLTTLVSVSDYEGEYSLYSDMMTWFDPPIVSLTGEVRDLKRETYLAIDEEGELREMVFRRIEGREHHGRPVFEYYQDSTFPEVGCSVEMIGEARQTDPPASQFYETPYYNFYGTTYLDCPGTSLALDSYEDYDDPGELVAAATGIFHIYEK